jgi:AmiR/NasT family two-component response regulator
VFADHEAFQAAETPLLVVDTDLVIRDANAAYLAVTACTPDQLLGMPIFEAFPDNPDDPQADGVTNLNASFELVFRSAHRHYMPLQRYDIPVRSDPPTFVRKFWAPVNSPLHDENGRLIGALHHVEDVTTVVDFVLLSSSPASASSQSGSVVTGTAHGPDLDQRAWNTLLTTLARETVGHAQADATATQLEHALASRVVIEQAKGMIAARDNISVDDAFTRLRQHSNNHNASLHEIARAVVELGVHV